MFAVLAECCLCLKTTSFRCKYWITLQANAASICEMTAATIFFINIYSFIFQTINKCARNKQCVLVALL